MTSWLVAGAAGFLAAAQAQETNVALAHLDSLAAVLEAHPPTFAADPAREQAFLGLDRFFEAAVRPGQPFDLAEYPNDLWRWIDRRLQRALAEAEAAPGTADKLTVWQMYNMGLLCRSGKAVVGMDLTPVLPEADAFNRRVAALVDVLLVTHGHGDHYAPGLVHACLAAGKPVFLPAASAAELPPDPCLFPVDDFREAEVSSVRLTARRGIHVWAAGRETVPIVYYELAFPSGHAAIFCGDLDYTRAFEKTPGLAIDLLVVPWRSPNESYEPGSPRQTAERKDAVQIAIDRIQPRHLLYGHYAELGHVHGGMPASYEIAAGLKRAVATPSEWMFWGEKLVFPPIP